MMDAISVARRYSSLGGVHWSHAPKPDGDLEDKQVGRPLLQAAPIADDGAHAFIFGRFCLHRRELLADGRPISIGNRALDVLIVLIEARGALVSKDDLLSRVWPNTTVEENSLQYQISVLRKALGASRDFIKTVSGRGYRFVSKITIAGTTTCVSEGNSAFDQGARVVAQVDEPASNLPAPTSDLVGREVDLAEVAGLVTENRLVTLVGAGGMGKSRLGIELARRLLPQFADGAWVAELGPLSNPELVPTAIATALGFALGPASLHQGAAALASRHLLLVLDGCEHVIDTVASCTETILHANASLHVLATSRESLRAEGERIYRVPPLDMPPEGTEALDKLLQYSAAKLFISLTQAAEPNLSLDERIVTATVEICRRLDGMPLAIELAAAHAAAFGVQELASRLEERFGLLIDGRRTAPARHQTLRATFDWSYALLSEPERAVMRCLSIFGGPFTMEEAAHTVAAGREMTISDIGHYLASLVRKSLIASDFDGPVRRYRLLETTRAYVMDKLTASARFISCENA